jgi:hypothetical protein
MSATSARQPRVARRAHAALLAGAVAAVALGISTLGATATAAPISPNFHCNPGDAECNCVASGGTWDITESDDPGSIDGGGACMGGGDAVATWNPPPPPPPTTSNPPPPRPPVLGRLPKGTVTQAVLAP